MELDNLYVRSLTDYFEIEGGWLNECIYLPIPNSIYKDEDQTHSHYFLIPLNKFIKIKLNELLVVHIVDPFGESQGVGYFYSDGDYFINPLKGVTYEA